MEYLSWGRERCEKKGGWDGADGEAVEEGMERETDER